MADAVTTNVIFEGDRHYLVQFSNESDGTGETTVAKVDASALTPAPDYLTIEEIEYQVQGFNYLTILFNATANDEAVVLSGNGYIDYRDGGGLANPKSTGYNGDILFTTDGGADGSMYNVVMKLKKHYN